MATSAYCKMFPKSIYCIGKSMTKTAKTTKATDASVSMSKEMEAELKKVEVLKDLMNELDNEINKNPGKTDELIEKYRPIAEAKIKEAGL